MHDLLSECLEHRPHALEDRGAAADHHGQCPFLCPTHAATHGRVDEVDAAPPQPIGDLSRCCRLTGCAVHERRAGAEASEQADLPIEERRDVRRVRQAGDDDVRATCRVSWRRRLARARRRGEFPRASLGAIPDHEWKPGIGNPLRHRLTDGSESEESNVHQRRALGVERGARRLQEAIFTRLARHPQRTTLHAQRSTLYAMPTHRSPEDLPVAALVAPDILALLEESPTDIAAETEELHPADLADVVELLPPERV